MPEQRHVYRVGTSLVLAIPARVRAHLAVKRGDAVYWHVTRGGEAIVAPKAERVGGRPEGLALERQLAAALAEIARLRARDAAREQTLYAEGHTAGYAAAMERLMKPHGASAARALALRARLGARASRSARRKDARAARGAVEVQPAPVLAPESAS